MTDAAEERAEPFSLRSPIPARPWVIILGVVIGLFLLFLVLLVIPSVDNNEIRMETQQTAAASRLRAIAMGQTLWHKNDYDKNNVFDYTADYSQLYYATVDGETVKIIDQAQADADFSRPGYVPRSGYIFADIPNDAMGVPFDYAKEWAVVAWPAAYNRSGLLTFVVNETGTVYQKDRGANASPLVNFPDVAAEGWMLVH